MADRNVVAGVDHYRGATTTELEHTMSSSGPMTLDQLYAEELALMEKLAVVRDLIDAKIKEYADKRAALQRPKPAKVKAP